MVPIKNYEDSYYFDENFEIWSKDREFLNKAGKLHVTRKRKLKPFKKSGYWAVCLSKKGKNTHFHLHRLLALHFLKGFKDGYEVNHIDGNRLNNNLTNLEWCTHGQNMQHASKILKVGNQKKVYQYTLKGEFVKEWINSYEVTRVLKIEQQNISKCCNNIRKYAGNYQWSYIKKDRLNSIDEANNISKKVNQFNLEGKFIKSYNSMGEICALFNFKKNMLSYYLNKYNKEPVKYGEHKWKFQ